MLLGHLAYLLKLSLEFTHLGEDTVDVVSIGTHSHELVNDLLLTVEISLQFGFDGCTLGSLFLLNDSCQFFECLLRLVDSRHECLGIVTLDSHVSLALGPQFVIAE